MIYDLDLNKDRDRIQLWRKGRVAHQWTRQEAELIKRQLAALIPRMVPKMEEK